MQKVLPALSLALALVACKPKAAELAGDAYPVAATSGTSYSLDTEKSILRWRGSKVTGKHNGTVAFKSGALSSKSDIITSGRFVIDLNTIEDEDLAGTPWKAKLEQHLKESDFFEVGKFPEGVFEIASAVPGADGKVEVRGNLTLKGITKGISFPATVVFENGKPVSAKGVAVMNRQQWGIVYKGKPDDLINDEIQLEFDLVTKL